MRERESSREAAKTHGYEHITHMHHELTCQNIYKKNDSMARTRQLKHSHALILTS